MKIVICTSMWFYALAYECADRLRGDGHEAVLPSLPCREPNEEEKARLGEIHLEKIAESDAIYVVNKGGYIGQTVAHEIEFARESGKEIMYLE